MDVIFHPHAGAGAGLTTLVGICVTKTLARHLTLSRLWKAILQLAPP